MRSTTLLPLLLASAIVACADQGDEDAGAPADAPDADPVEGVVLGPADGHELPPSDLDRVQVGDAAPDFTLTSLAGPPVTLSSFRGASDVVLVFYRGHW